MGTLHEDQYTFLMISRWILLRTINISDKCTENRNAYLMFNNDFFLENHVVYEIMWNNTVQPSRPQMTMWRMRIARWIPKATNTHSECVIIISFQLQQRMHERVSKLRHWYTACLVNGAGDYRLHIRGIVLRYSSRERHFSSKVSRPVLGSAKRCVKLVPRAPTKEVQRPQRETNKRPPSRDEVKNERKYTSTPQYDFMECRWENL
jgi:hypothetical protein